MIVYYLERSATAVDCFKDMVKMYIFHKACKHDIDICLFTMTNIQNSNLSYS